MKIGVVQFTGSVDYEDNLIKLERFCSQALAVGVKALFLPECFYSFSDGKKLTDHLVTFDNKHFDNISKLAQKHSLYLIGGSVAFKDGSHIFNRALNFDPNGELISYYDKQNLFSCELTKKDGSVKKIDEGNLYSKRQNSCIVNIDDLSIGITICFDIRFNQIFEEYRTSKVDAISIASAFTVPTGLAHWHLLNRARAVETQSYIISSAQYGENSKRIKTYGHSLIVDPWGDILDDAGEKETMIVSELSKDRIDKVRSSIILF